MIIDTEYDASIGLDLAEAIDLVRPKDDFETLSRECDLLNSLDYDELDANNYRMDQWLVRWSRILEKGERDPTPAEFLYSSETLRVDETFKWTVLFFAARCSHQSVLGWFLNNGEVVVDHQDCRGNTLLVYVVNRGHVKAVAKILEHAPNLDLLSDEGKTQRELIYLACSSREIAKLMEKYDSMEQAS